MPLLIVKLCITSGDTIHLLVLIHLHVVMIVSQKMAISTVKNKTKQNLTVFLKM